MPAYSGQLGRDRVVLLTAHGTCWQCLHTCHASMAEHLFSLIRCRRGADSREMTPRQLRLSLVLLVLLPYLQRKMERICAPQINVEDDQVSRRVWLVSRPKDGQIRCSACVSPANSRTALRIGARTSGAGHKWHFKVRVSRRSSAVGINGRRSASDKSRQRRRAGARPSAELEDCRRAPVPVDTRLV